MFCKTYLTLIHSAELPLLDHHNQTMPAAYIEHGDGAPLLLLHGFLGKSHCWQPLMEHLGLRYRCIALDLLGFGNSAKPMMRYDIATEVAFVHQFLETLQIGTCHLVGHSFGGWVAAAYALAYPDRVQGLVLAAAAGIRDDSFCGRYDHLRPLLWETPLIDWGLQVVSPIARVVGQSGVIDQLSWFRRELMAEPAARSFLCDRLRPEDAIDTVEQLLSQLQVPTLVITGDQDETIPLWHSETYAREIPNARLVIIPNANHSLPQTYSQELAQEILPFLSL